MLLARAGILLEQEPRRTGEIIMGLRLLNEEEYLPKNLRARIAVFRELLEDHQKGTVSFDELTSRLSSFLAVHAVYRTLLYPSVES
jgi:hypothetical protein